VASSLTVNRRDVGGDVISELGFSLAVWNGAEASLDRRGTAGFERSILEAET
jgi:hypothetical protein